MGPYRAIVLHASQLHKMHAGRSGGAANDREPSFGAARGEVQVGGEGIDFEAGGFDGLDVPAGGEGLVQFIARDSARAVAGGFGVAEAEEQENTIGIED